MISLIFILCSWQGERITFDEVWNLTKEKLDKGPITEDLYYYTIKRNDIYLFLRRDRLDKKRYLPEIRDCEDFAIMFWGRTKERFPGAAIGIVKFKTPFGAHCVNLFISIKKKIWLVDARKDKIFRKPNEWRTEYIFF